MRATFYEILQGAPPKTFKNIEPFYQGEPGLKVLKGIQRWSLYMPFRKLASVAPGEGRPATVTEEELNSLLELTKWAADEKAKEMKEKG